ncbi:hypothetical protein DEO23_05595 [Brachybacterium endophyticum]|uniref:histidine kinase n=1 Tax=Brachybacterium endophyticum TaxID=2182385 RepID=A0A2U2RKP6_9MICO|nr:HAMP domain-containing sensor histidine kinase [Brachybacterium endophyticum]PWH06443.1 hypothetical protein DEO23_05595 [Brachybacterium endophyticum]
MSFSTVPRALYRALTSPHDGHAGKQVVFLGYVIGISFLLAAVDLQLVLSPEYLLGIAALTALTAVAGFLRPRLKSTSNLWMTLPIADILAVALLRDVFRVEAATVTLLSFAPVLWAAYCWRYVGAVRASLALTLSFAASTTIRELPAIDGTVLVRCAILLLATLQVSLLVALATTRATQERARSEKALRERTELLHTTTGQKQLLQNVIDSLSVGIVIVDKDGHDVLMNSVQKKLHVLAVPEGDPDPPEDRLLVRYPESSTPIPPDSRPVRRAVERETFTNYVVALGPVSGPNRTLTTSARQIVDVNGARDGAVIVFSDVTDFVDGARRQQQRTANVSHEMRTPLTSILGYLDLTLESPDLDTQTRNYLEVADRNAEQMLNYVEDLLSGLAEAREDRALDARPTPLGILVRDACEALLPRAAGGEVELRCTIESEASILLDPPRMTQVLNNLISNAIKYTLPGGSIDVRVHEVPGALEVQVSDTGIGMAPDEQANLFMEYYRTSAVAEGHIPGYGLGLSIAQRIVRAHGGQISVRSTEGKGSTFTVQLPRENLFLAGA